MQLMKKLVFGFVVSSLFVCWGTKVFASAVVTISSSGSGSYALQGTGLAGVSGAKFTIAYDAATLANPRVTQGGLAAGALMVANTNAPGAVVIAFIKHPGSISGDGTLATISFDPVGNAPGVIQSLAAELIDTNGARIDAQAQVANPASPLVESSTNATTTGSAITGSQQTAPASAGSTPVRSLGGQLIMPAEEEAAKEKGRDEFSLGAAPQKETSVAPAGEEGVTARLSGDASAGVAPDRKNDTKSVVFRSVLDQFRSFNGVKTPEALSALFTQHETPGIVQVPPIALSDGASPVRVSIRLAGTCKEAPSFNLLDAQLISLKVEGANAWAIELLPKKGTYQTAIRMLQCGSETEIPVTVAPPLGKEVASGTGGKLTEADFKRFLDESGTAKAYRFDLNGDGVRNYIDDFIFTANYLVQRGGKLK